jgi:hypothetical protein
MYQELARTRKSLRGQEKISIAVAKTPLTSGGQVQSSNQFPGPPVDTEKKVSGNHLLYSSSHLSNNSS